jgi:hypothetical protein
MTTEGSEETENGPGPSTFRENNNGPLLFSLFSRFSQKLPSTSFFQNLVSKIFTTI